MQHSEQMNELAAALAKAQSEMKNAGLNKVNPHFKSKYADLPTIRDAVMPVLTKHGMAITQTYDVDEQGRSYVVTILMHSSGQWLSSKCPVKADRDGPQPFGSASTYARRYSLAAIAGIAAEEDDDAESAQGNGQAGAKPNNVTPARTAQPKQADEPWKINAETIRGAIDASKDLDDLNAIMDGYLKELEEIKSKSATAHKFLLDRAQARRGFHAQAPANAA